jgi:hypothetical protein
LRRAGFTSARRNRSNLAERDRPLAFRSLSFGACELRAEESGEAKAPAKRSACLRGGDLEKREAARIARRVYAMNLIGKRAEEIREALTGLSAKVGERSAEWPRRP